MIKTMKIGSNFIVVLLVQSLLLAPGAYSLGEHSPEANTLSPAIAVNSPDFIKAIVDARVSRRTPDKFSAELSPEERRAFGEEIGNICAFNHKEWVELRNSDIPSRILTRFNKLKKERKETSGTVLGFMLAELGFGENIPLWKAEGDYDKAVRVMRDKIIPFLQKYEFDPVTGQFENRSETCSEEKLVRQGDLYYSRFVETAFSDAVYKKLSVKTGGIANTVCGNAWKFGELIEAATERRVLAGQVVRAYYQRQILPMLEEIYKYTPFLLRQRMQQETRTRLSRAVYFYETSRTASVFSLDEQDIGDIVFVHKILKAKLPSRDFIDRVRNILDLRDWLRKTEKLSEPDQTLLSALDKYWPSGQVDGTLISRTIGKDSADISAFHEVFVEPVRGFLNSRLWRWRGRLESGQRDYWTLLRRSPGWFSLLGAADFLKKENYGRTEDQTGPVTLVDLDAFYSSLFGAIREKEGRIPEGVRIIDAVTDPLAAQFGANPDKEDISFTADWPFAPESIDVMVSGFNLYRLNSQELLDRFVRVNAGLKTAGKFIVTVPANLYIPDQGIELLGELGFELKLERVATEELKSSEKHRLGEEGDAVAAGISKRQFYLMVFEKTGNADPDAIKAISPAELQRFGFVEAPAVKESRKLTPSQLPREENGLTVSPEEKIAIEDIAAEHLKLNYITDGWLGKKRAAVNVTHFKTMLENINMVQEVLLDTLARMEEPGNEEAKELFDMLANILEHYDEISRFSETELQGIDFSQQEAVTALDRLAKQQCPFLEDYPEFRTLAAGVLAFAALNGDFFTPEQTQRAAELKPMYKDGVILSEDANLVAEKFITLHREIAALENDIALLVQKWNNTETAPEVKGRDLWSLIRESSGWPALNFIAKQYAADLNNPGNKVFILESTMLLRKIIAQAMRENKLPPDIAVLPDAGVGPKAKLVFSLFDWTREGPAGIAAERLLAARAMLLEQDGTLVMVMNKNAAHQNKDDLKKFGFEIVRGNYGNAVFDVVILKAKLRVEEKLAALNRLRGKSNLSKAESEELFTLWSERFREDGFRLGDELREAMRSYFGILPTEQHFRIMLKSLCSEYKAAVKKRREFISLAPFENFFGKLNQDIPLNLDLYDRADARGRIANGILGPADPEYSLTALEQYAFIGFLREMRKVVREMDPAMDQGVVSFFRGREASHMAAYDSELNFSPENLETVNTVFADLRVPADSIDEKAIDAKINALLECPDEQLEALKNDLLNYVWEGERRVKTVLAAIRFRILSLQSGLDPERVRRVGAWIYELKNTSFSAAEIVKTLLFFDAMLKKNREDIEFYWLGCEAASEEKIRLMWELRKDFKQDFGPEVPGHSEEGLTENAKVMQIIMCNLPVLSEVDQKPVLASFLGDNVNDEEYFRSQWAGAFFFSYQIFGQEVRSRIYGLNRMRTNVRERYLEIYGQVIGYFEQDRDLFANAEDQPAADADWIAVRNKVDMVKAYNRIFFTPEDLRIIERGKSIPLEPALAARMLDIDYVNRTLSELLPTGLAAADVPALDKFESLLGHNYYVAAIGMFRKLTEIGFQAVNAGQKANIQAMIRDLLSGFDSLFAVYVMFPRYPDDDKEFKIRLAQKIVPDERFADFLEMVTDQEGSEAFIATLIEHNDRVVRALVSMFDSGNGRDIAVAIRVICDYIERYPAAFSREFYKTLWVEMLKHHKYRFDNVLETKIDSLIVELPAGSMPACEKLIQEALDETKYAFDPNDVKAVERLIRTMLNDKKIKSGLPGLTNDDIKIGDIWRTTLIQQAI